MTQKAQKEQIPQLLAEMINRQSNLKTIELVQNFLANVPVAGPDAVANLHRCFSWLQGVSQGEAARVKEVQGLLPDQDTEIKLGEPEQPEAEAPKPDVSVGGVELEKGSPVLGPA